MPVLIGTSGWQYAHWKRVFYADRLPQRVWLERDRGRTVTRLPPMEQVMLAPYEPWSP